MTETNLHKLFELPDEPTPRKVTAWRIKNRRPPDSLIYFCADCARWHWHGAPKHRTGQPEVRLSHCGPDRAETVALIERPEPAPPNIVADCSRPAARQLGPALVAARR